MLNFIYMCVAVIIISFVSVPVVTGISDEYKNLDQGSQLAETPINQDSSLSFEQIAVIADEAQLSNPNFLNNIMPAAGADIGAPMVDEFSRGFEEKAHPAL